MRFDFERPQRLMSALLLAFTLCGGEAHAWSGRAHAMVADIASRLLTPSAAAAVDDLLRDDLLADGKRSGRVTLAQVASWADELRATPEQRSTAAYHYDDIPVCGVADRATYCRDGKCATAWFTHELVVLKDRTQPHRVRNEALKWITHLVGDLHQPLHASDHDDRGGNDVPVSFFDRQADEPIGGREQPPYNLHTAWDRLIPYKAIDDAGGYDRFLADLPTAATRAAWEIGTIEQWTDESHVLAQDFVYPALTDFECRRPLAALQRIGDGYDRPASLIASMQLRKAGVRLAKVLNDALTAR